MSDKLMSRRDTIAAMALQGLLSDFETITDFEILSEYNLDKAVSLKAVLLADALIKELDKDAES